MYSVLFISKSYKKIGFVHKPFFIAGFGGIAFLTSIALPIYYTFNYIEYPASLFYNLFFYLVVCTFSIIHYLTYIIEYPSLLQPKWRALMPFDIIKVTASITLAFFALSLYFTIKNTPFYEIYASVNPGWYLLVLLLTLLIALVSFYTRVVGERTGLKYWNYLKAGLFVHTGASFYVLALVIFSWKNLGEKPQTLGIFYLLLLFAFYIFYILDLRSIVKNLRIKIEHDPLNLSRYFISYISIFFIIFFGISLTYGKLLPVVGSLNVQDYPLVIGFIVVFLISYIGYLSTTHKGFEELMEKNIWTNLSYLSGFAAFVIVYLLYRSFEGISKFPLHGAFFFAYFAVLIIEIYAINTLKIKHLSDETHSTVDLLNHHAGFWIRVDALQKILEDIKNRFADEYPEVKDIELDEMSRTFWFPENMPENIKNAVAVAILLSMYTIRDAEKFSLKRQSMEELVGDIERILGMDILNLPKDLRQHFDTTKYYPRVLEDTLKAVSEKISAFVPEKENKNIISKLAKISPFFKSLIEGTSPPPMNEKEFCRNLKLYLDSLEESFPFEYSLFRTAIAKTINEKLSSHGIKGEEALNIIPTGIEAFDELIGGGLTRNSSTLILTDETRGKSLFIRSFVVRGLKNRDAVIYFTSTTPHSEFRDDMLKELPAAALKNLTILDLHRTLNTAEALTTLRHENGSIIVPLNLTLIQHAIVKSIKSLPKERQKRVIIDIFSDLLTYYKWEEVEEILLRHLEGHKRWNCTSIIILNPDLIPRRDIEAIKRYFDNILLLQSSGRDIKITIEKLYGGLPKERSVIIKY
ncbi:RAD55 family ATPase [Candidatus Pyrohabitans sp.]